jgi:hypothetical protein
MIRTKPFMNLPTLSLQIIGGMMINLKMILNKLRQIKPFMLETIFGVEELLEEDNFLRLRESVKSKNLTSLTSQTLCRPYLPPHIPTKKEDKTTMRILRQIRIDFIEEFFSKS